MRSNMINKSFKIMELYFSLLGRILIALPFIMSGINKIINYGAFENYMSSADISSNMLPIVIIIEILAPLFILVGWRSRISAILLAVFSICAAIIFHSDFSNQMQMGMFMKNLMIAGGLLILASMGPGQFSINKEH